MIDKACFMLRDLCMLHLDGLLKANCLGKVFLLNSCMSSYGA